MKEPTIELRPYSSDTKVEHLANQHGLSYEEIRDCLKKSNSKLCFEEKKRTKNISIKKKIEEEKEVLRKRQEEKEVLRKRQEEQEVLRKRQEEQSVEIEEDFDFGMTP